MTSYPQQRARLRALLGRSPQTGASSLAPSAPPVVLGHTTGGASTCTGAECEGCSVCVALATGTCDACDQPYRGDVTHYERADGTVRLSLHTACDEKGARPLPARVALALGATGHELTFGSDGRWTA